MKTFEISMRGDWSQKVKADSESDAVIKYAKKKGWGTKIGAMNKSNINSNQYTVGSNKKGWYQVWVQDVTKPE